MLEYIGDVYFNWPFLKVGNMNSTQGILRMVVAGNVKCLRTRWQEG